MAELDALDLALVTALRENPRAGALELSRLTRVARATVESRLSRIEQAGVITGYGPDIDVAAAGFTVLAFVTLSIAQGALDRGAGRPGAIPAVLEAYAITGSATWSARSRRPRTPTCSRCCSASTPPLRSPAPLARSPCPRSSPRATSRCCSPAARRGAPLPAFR